VNWERDGEEIRNHIDPVTGRLNSRPQNTDFYFRPGLTWPLRTTSGISFRVLPSGSIFGHKGPTAFVREPLLFLGIVQSMPFSAIIQLQVGAADEAARSYEVGIIQDCPIPLVQRIDPRIQELVRESIDLKRKMALTDETTHVFCRPSVLMVNEPDLVSRAVKWTTLAGEWTRRLSNLQREIDQLVAEAYGIPIEEWESLTANLEKIGFTSDEDDEEPEDEKAGMLTQPPDGVELSNAIADVLSYVVGTIFGRWDIRLAIGQRPLPELPDAFAPLPVCSPGMLTGPTGLPVKLEEVPPDYPIPIQWDGIIPDDEGHPRDLIAQVHRVFAILFPDRDPREVEAEACAVLGARDLRSWFANQFFQYHIKRYSKSRRKAPIYWQLRSPRKSFSIWLYYHRLTGDTLWTVLRNYVDPKLEHEQEVLTELKAKLEVAQKAGQGREERRLVREIQKQQQLLEELTQFRADIYEVASMGYEPDRDDGVKINIAPLHKLVPWPEAARAWRELQEGKYPWSTMHKRLGIGNRGR